MDKEPLLPPKLETGARFRIPESEPELTKMRFPLLSVSGVEGKARASIVGSGKIGRVPLCNVNSMAVESAVIGLARLLGLPLYQEFPEDPAPGEDASALKDNAAGLVPLTVVSLDAA